MNRSKPKNPGRTYLLIAGLILLVAAGVYAWVQSQPAGGSVYKTMPAVRGALTASIAATGTIRSAHSVLLVWNAGGRVETVNAGLGDKVTSDQVLASLASDSVSQAIILAEADLVTAKQDLNTLLQSTSNNAQAMQNLSVARQAVQDAQDSHDHITRKRVSNQLIQDTSDLIVKAKNQLKFQEYFFNLFYSHRADGSSDKAQMLIQLTNTRQNISDLTAKYNWFVSQSSPIDVEKALAALNLAKAREADAEREMERQKNGANPDDLAAARARVAAAQATLQHAQILAPFNGTITQAQPQSGDRVSTGQTAFRVDDLSQLMVNLQISEVDINNVQDGQPVEISLEAVPNQTYHGIVSKVNQSAQTGQAGINFSVVVTLTDPDQQVKPGMTASVIINVRQIGDALLVPNSAIRMLNNQRYVYILKNNQPVPVGIRLGASANDNSQVVGGDLKSGDLIILNPPSPTPHAATPTP